MSEAHGEPPADVRSFLPRPGEPVEDYAERLRALHRDLTLVLEAVERGLAASAERDAPAAPPEPEPESAFEPEPVAAPRPEPEPVLLKPDAVPGGPRIEVVPGPAAAATRQEGEERRGTFRLTEDMVPAEPPLLGTPAFPARPSAAQAPEPAAPAEPAWVERPDAAAPLGTAVAAPPAPAQATAPPPVRVEAADRPPSPADRPWVRSSAGGEPPAWGTQASVPARRRLPPLLVAALLTGWLLAIALLLALALD